MVMLLRVVEKLAEPETGKVVPPAWQSTVGAMGGMVKPHMLAKASLMTVLEVPVSGKELTFWVPDGVDSHKYNGGVGEGVLEQYSTWAIWHSSSAICAFSFFSFFFLSPSNFNMPFDFAEAANYIFVRAVFPLMFFWVAAGTLFLCGLNFTSRGWWLVFVTFTLLVLRTFSRFCCINFLYWFFENGLGLFVRKCPVDNAIKAEIIRT